MTIFRLLVSTHVTEGRLSVRAQTSQALSECRLLRRTPHWCHLPSMKRTASPSGAMTSGKAYKSGHGLTAGVCLALPHEASQHSHVTLPPAFRADLDFIMPELQVCALYRLPPLPYVPCMFQPLVRA